MNKTLDENGSMAQALHAGMELLHDDDAHERMRSLLSQGGSFHVVNLGCKVNRVESDTIAAAFAQAGGRASRECDADVIVVNTCTVTGEADKKTRKAVRHALSVAPDAWVVATGCATAIDPDTYRQLSPRVTVEDRAELLAFLNELGQGASLRMGEGFRTRVSLKVQDGCNRACTYCIVHVARGRARSVAFDDVLQEARRYFASGVKEVVLTGIDLGSYDSDGMKLHDLVTALLEQADRMAPAGEQPARVRASSLEPHSLTPAFADLLARGDGRLCRHVHLPLQAGSTRVLREMGRPYTADGFRDLVERLYEAVPSLSITTDIICGFPGETEKDFQQTLELARTCRFSKIHVFPYSMRAGTPAAVRTDQVPAAVKAERSERLRRLSDELRATDLQSRIGTTELAVVEGATMLTESYHELATPAGASPGAFVEVHF